MPGAAARARAAAGDAEAARGPVQLESARQQRGRLEPRTLRRLPRSGDLARLPVGGGIRRAQPLLPPERTAARAAAVARGRMALGLYNPAHVRTTERAMNADADKPAAETIERLEGIAERRVCLPNTRFMIHQPGGGAGGPATDIAIQAKEILRTRERIARVIAKQTGKTYEKVLADMERDFWMNAAEAVEYGIVSRVIESSRELT